MFLDSSDDALGDLGGREGDCGFGALRGTGSRATHDYRIWQQDFSSAGEGRLSDESVFHLGSFLAGRSQSRMFRRFHALQGSG